MTDFNVRIPPDSTGKRIAVHATLEVDYSSGTIAFSEGDLIVCVTSGVTGEIEKVIGTTSAGELHINLAYESPTTAIVGENIQVGGVTYAVASSTGTAFYIQENCLVGHNNTHNGVFVDNRGGMYTRFTEGSPTFDAFGRMQISQATSLAEYVQTYDDLPNSFETKTVTGGSSAHDPNIAGSVLTCTTAVNASVSRRSHVYDKYQSGVSHLVEMTCYTGDTGKAEVTRRWGYYDGNDGLFFELAETTLNVVIRSSTSGTPVETRVAQADWNNDKVNGTSGANNLSKADLDVSKDNIYWIDFQWLGAGKVRFGVVIDGKRIVCHEFQNANNKTAPYMKTGSLPVSYEQFNSASGSGSSSEFRFICATVFSEGAFAPPKRSFAADNGVNITVNSDTVYVPLFSGRAKQTFKGQDNRSWAMPYEADFWTGTATAPVIIELVKDAVLTGATWAVDPSSDSCMEVDIAANAATGGTILMSRIVTGHEHADMRDIFNFDGELITRKATITDDPSIYTIRAKTLINATSTLCRASLNWEEVQ